MLTFITGQPGAGKTLWAVSTLNEMAKKQGRPVYYNGSQLKEITLENWHDLGIGTDWHDAPEGSLILLDEAHRELFPMRKIGAPVPSHVDAMSTHRHRGHDVFITAQHSTQVDTFIRKMAGEHHHLIRRFGTNRSTRFQWMEHSNERDQWERKKAQTAIFKYPRDYFGTYKSTVLNTVEPKLPWLRIGGLAAAALLVPVLIFAGLSAVSPDSEGTPDNTTGQPDTSVKRPFMTNMDEERIVDRPILYDDSTWDREITDIPFSAKLFDNIVEVVSYPRISGCSHINLGNGDRCDCYSQQGTNLRVSYRMCRDYMKYGAFDFSKPDAIETLPPAVGNDGPPAYGPSAISTSASSQSGAASAAASQTP
jgi:zona occludens toxin